MLGEETLSAADLDALRRAAALNRPLVRLRGQWTLVDAHKLVCAGTAEESVDALIRRKRDLA